MPAREFDLVIVGAGSGGLTAAGFAAQLGAKNLRQAIEQVYQFESSEELQKRGIEVIQGAGHFLDAQTIRVGEQLVRGRAFPITTGARPRIPSIEGLRDLPFLTYEQIFDNDRRPGLAPAANSRRPTSSAPRLAAPIRGVSPFFPSSRLL